MKRHCCRALIAINYRRARAAVFIVAICVLVQGCSGKTERSNTDPVASSGTPTVVVTNSVVEYFVKTLCEDRVLVVKISSVEDLAGWRPAAEQVRQLQQADLVLLSGANYEPWAAQLSLPRSRVVDTSAAYLSQLVSVQSVAHQHGPNGQGTEEELAWATWLDPELAIQQVRDIEDAVCRLLPESTQMFVERSNALSAELEELDQRMETLAAKMEGLVVEGDPLQHSYLARRLNCRLIAAAPGTDISGVDLVLYSGDGVNRAGVPSVEIQTCDRLSDFERLLDCLAKNLDRLEARVQSSEHLPDSGRTSN